MVSQAESELIDKIKRVIDAGYQALVENRMDDMEALALQEARLFDEWRAMLEAR